MHRYVLLDAQDWMTPDADRRAVDARSTARPIRATRA